MNRFVAIAAAFGLSAAAGGNTRNLFKALGAILGAAIEALHTMAGQPFGVVLLIAVALGFAAFGVYCFGDARCRRM